MTIRLPGPPDRYEGRISGVFDVPADADFGVGDNLRLAVHVNAKNLAFRTDAKGDQIASFTFTVHDVSFLPARDPDQDVWDFLDGTTPIETRLQVIQGGGEADYVELAETTVTVDQLGVDDVQAHDAEDGEVFNPSTQSRERARLASAGRDPVLQRFLNGGE